MSKTLRFGTDPARRASLIQRIDRYVMPRRSPQSFDAVRAAEDFSRQVAMDVTPRLTAPNYVTFAAHAKGFGKR